MLEDGEDTAGEEAGQDVEEGHKHKGTDRPRLVPSLQEYDCRLLCDSETVMSVEEETRTWVAVKCEPPRPSFEALYV